MKKINIVILALISCLLSCGEDEASRQLRKIQESWASLHISSRDSLAIMESGYDPELVLEGNSGGYTEFFLFEENIRICDSLIEGLYARIDALPEEVLARNKYRDYVSFLPQGALTDADILETGLRFRQIEISREYHTLYAYREGPFDNSMEFPDIALDPTNRDDRVKTFRVKGEGNPPGWPNFVQDRDHGGISEILEIVAATHRVIDKLNEKSLAQLN